MTEYEGLNEKDLKVIQIALQRMQITGAEAPMMVNLQQKIEMELDFVKSPKSKRPKKGDTLIKG